MASTDEVASKEERILAAAGELLLAHGFRGVTIADVARLAHVGKGTVYLYWSTKEELLVELFARDMLDAIDQLSDLLDTDPGVVLPRRLLPLIQDLALDRPFLRALQTYDADLLGLLTEHPRTVALSRAPGMIVLEILAVLRNHGLVRTDLPPDRQAYTAQALAVGFLGLTTGVFPPGGAGIGVDHPAVALSNAARLLLEPEEKPEPEAIASAAADARAIIATQRAKTSRGIAD